MQKNQTKYRQRGAIGLYATIVLILIVLFATLAVDSARLWMVKRQLQKIADIAAIEAASGVGCSAGLSNVAAKAQAAAIRNGFRGNFSTAPDNIELGSVITQNGRRHFNADGSARAVRVTATETVPASLIAGGIFNNEIVISATAVSLPNSPLVSFGIGATAVSINTEESDLLNSLVGGMLGTTINLDAVSWQGLANTDITIAQLLRAEGRALNVDEFLNTNFTTKEMLQIISDAVGLQSDLLPGVLNDTVYLADSAARNTSLKLADVIGVNQGFQEAAVDASVNLLSLLSTAVMVSNGNHAIAIPLSLNIPGLVSAGASVTVIEAPKIVIGPPGDGNGNICTLASSAQIRVDMKAGVNVGLGLLLPVANVNLDLSLEAARADAGLLSVERENSTINLRFNNSASLITINRNKQPLASIKVLGIPVADVVLAIEPNAVTTVETEVQIPQRWDFDDKPFIAVSTNAGNDGLKSLFAQPASLDLKILGGSLLPGVLNGMLANTIRPLLIQMSNVLLDPLLRLLGIKLNGADIIIRDVTMTHPQPLVI